MRFTLSQGALASQKILLHILVPSSLVAHLFPPLIFSRTTSSIRHPIHPRRSTQCRASHNLHDPVIGVGLWLRLRKDRKGVFSVYSGGDHGYERGVSVSDRATFKDQNAGGGILAESRGKYTASRPSYIQRKCVHERGIQILYKNTYSPPTMI